MGEPTPSPVTIYDESEFEPEVIVGRVNYDEAADQSAVDTPAVQPSGDSPYLKNGAGDDRLSTNYDTATADNYRSEVEPLRVGPSPYNKTASQPTVEGTPGSRFASPYDPSVEYDRLQDAPTDVAGVPTGDEQQQGGAYAGVVASPNPFPLQQSPAEKIAAVWNEIASWPWREALGMVPEMSRKTRAEREAIVADVFRRSGARPETAQTLAARYLDTAGELGNILGQAVGSAVGARVIRRVPGFRAQVHEYGISRKIGRTTVERHEILQHAWLKENGFVTRRGVGRSRFNTVLELTPQQHRQINALQRAAGLNNPKTLSKLSAIEVIDRNLVILRQAGVSATTRQLILEDVLELLPALGTKAYPAP